MPAVGDVANVLDARRPGREEIFGSHVWLDDLRDKIGRDEDTNANPTRRMLFVLESVPVAGDGIYRRARRALVAGYLDANVKDHRPPRFFLNDVIRYWRTIAVDFESKMRARKGEGWGLRNAKLRLSRKALFAGGLLPLLECYRYPADGMLDLLDERMSLPPLDRIADALLHEGRVVRNRPISLVRVECAEREKGCRGVPNERPRPKPSLQPGELGVLASVAVEPEVRTHPEVMLTGPPVVKPVRALDLEDEAHEVGWQICISRLGRGGRPESRREHDAWREPDGKESPDLLVTRTQR